LRRPDARGGGIVRAEAASASVVTVGDYDVTVAATEPGTTTASAFASVSTQFD
jgi:hypothetical protein